MNDMAFDKPKQSAERTASVVEDEAPTMPLLGGIVRPEGLPEAADLEITAIKPANRMFSQGTMLVVAAFVVAAGLLLVMKMGSGTGIDAGADREIVQKIEQTLIQLSSPEAMSPDAPLHARHIQSIRDDAGELGRMFNVDYTQKQVPIEYVKKNPFRLAMVHVATEGGPMVQIDTGAAQRLAKLQAEFAKLRLQTIMKGRPNVAVINDEICREGQKIGPFTIAKIESLSVKLTAEGQEFTLQMDSGPRR